MKRYQVEFSDDAKQELMRSFEWGREAWGTEAAIRWYRKIKAKTRETLMRFPLAQPVAPESNDAGGEVRNLIIGRYRILFEIEGDTVRVLHVRGAFVSEPNTELGVDE